MELTLEDFATINGEPSLEERKQLTRKLCAQYKDNTFSGDELRLAKDILILLAEDIEVTIRRILAENLKNCPALPRSVALKLARDVEGVSIPILEFSTVLREEDLVEIIKSTKEAGKLTAIAKRSNISEIISDSLIDSKNHLVVETLMGNKNARIADSSLEKAVDIFRKDESVLSALIARGGLPISLAERMVAMVSQNMQKEIKRKYGISNVAISNISRESYEKTVLDMLLDKKTGRDKQAAQELATHLYGAGKLTPSLLLRALCKNEVEFFMAGMAKLAGIPASNAYKLVQSSNSFGFEALYQASQMPENLMKATEILLKFTMSEEKHENYTISSQRIMERIMDKGYDKTIPNMPYLMALMGEKPADSFKR